MGFNLKIGQSLPMNLLRQITSAISGKPGVRELGTPAMALFNPEGVTKRATFGMS